MYVCLWSPDWSTAGASSAAEVAPGLSDLAPRLRVEPGVIWADGRGLDAAVLAERLLDRLATAGVSARAGVARVPIAAELAARRGASSMSGASGGKVPFLVKERTGWGWRDGGEEARGEEARREEAQREKGRHSDLRSQFSDQKGKGRRCGRVVVVEGGREAEWMSELPVEVLGPDDRLRGLLDGVGVATVGALAGLAREAVEVRFGAAAVAFWRLARADDRRRLFRPIPPERPAASLDFIDYVLTDPSRLVFTANALLGPVCERLNGRGEHARTLRLTLPLANGEEWEREIRPARPTGSRETWLRLIRGVLDRLTVPDAVAGMRLEVGATEAAAVRQGDLFDRGFATASAVEAAVARLAERQVAPLAPESDANPRVERRTEWKPLDIEELGRTGSRSSDQQFPRTEPEAGPGPGPAGRGLTLHLITPPRPVRVESSRRRDHDVPVRVRDRAGWLEVVVSSGPDRISGGQWEPEPYARAYYRCVTEEGVQLWVYRDAVEGRWYLHGYWD